MITILLSLQNTSLFPSSVIGYVLLNPFFNFGFIGLFIGLALLGFFRFAVTQVMPSFILNQKQVQDDWLGRSSFTTILLPIMALFIFVFNVIAWFVYGIVSIVEFLAFVFRAVWWVIAWIWNELLHPVLFFVVKLLWHYIVIWSWRFFKIALTRIPEAFTMSTLLNGFISVLAISFVVFFFFYLSSILEQGWILVLMAFAFLFSVVYFSVFTLYEDSKRAFSEFWTSTAISKLGIMVIVSILSASIITVLHMFSGTAMQLPVLGISYPLSQVLIILFVVATVSALVTNSILPAYMVANNGDFDTKDFLINTGIRLPRLVGSIPFVLLGGLLASIATIIIGAFLWWSTNSIKSHFCNEALTNLKVELDMSNSHFRAFYSANNQPNMARDFTKTRVKRIAVLESRVFALNLFESNWLRIMQNLPTGIRSTQPEKNNIERFLKTFSDQSKKVSQDISEMEKSLSDKLTQIRLEPGNKTLADMIEDHKEKINELKLYQGKLESQYILNANLAQARIGSIKYTNVMWVIGTFFSLFGVVLLLAIILTPYWIYRTKFFFDLYDYHHDGKSYLAEQIEYYQGRNPNQPLLGFFVLLIIVMAVTLISIIL